MNAVTDFVKALGATRLIAMGGVAAILIGFFAFLILRWQTPDYTVLIANADLGESAQIAKELDRLQIKYETRNEGATLLVPRPDLPRIRMRLAEQGLPRGGGVGYEIFDKGESLGTTAFLQNINQLRALEGELARSIRSLDRVQSARVHLVIPERALFARDRQEPTASIVVNIRGTLEQPKVRAIQHLVASAVPGLKPQNVAIIDENGQLLASAKGDDAAALASGLDERKVAQENRLRREIEDILGKIVGPGRVRVQVAADLDYNRITQTQDLFDPEQKVVRSTQTRSEKSASQQGNNQVTVGNELPGAPGRGAPPAQNTSPADNQRDNSEKTEEVTNFEISRTQRQQVTEAGGVKRISVAVVVDGTYEKQGDTVNYQPRSQEDIDRITSIVRSAIGFNEGRGDKVDVVNLRFAEPPVIPQEAAKDLVSSFLSYSREEIISLVEIAVTFVLGLLILLLVIRPLLKTALGSRAGSTMMMADGQAPAMMEHGEAMMAHGEGDAMTPAMMEHGAGGKPNAQIASSPSAPIVLPESATARAIEVASLTSEMHAQAVERIGDIVNQNPREAAQIIRNWMYESAAA